MGLEYDGRERAPDRVQDEQGMKRQMIEAVLKFIQEQRAGIATWEPNGHQVPVKSGTLWDVYIMITPLLNQSSGREIGRVAQLYTRPSRLVPSERIATLTYGPSRRWLGLRRKRKHLHTKRYV